MSRRVLIGFIVLNVIVSLSVAFIVISIDRARRPDVEPLEGPTQIVILTATSMPGSGDFEPDEYQGTIAALQLTGTALSQRTAVAAAPTPDAGGDVAAGVPGEQTVVTIDPALLPDIPTDLPPGEPSVTPQDDGCIRHIVQSGDVIISIAQQYGVFPGDILIANGLDENHILQIGDVLIIPVEGCDALNTPTPVPSPSNTPFELTRVAPTVTLPPTAVNAQVVITNVMGWGDVNNETVEIRNLGSVLNLQGWTLSSEAGETFRFPEFRMQQGSLVRIYTRQGPTTPAALFWGRETAAWGEGDTLTLMDSAGEIQATFRVGETPELFPDVTTEPGTDEEIPVE
ncbi:MAG: lamin tail domain-containing protein [Anaerolineae bacterium]|jgi:LysM repeat protein|nr:lamin tail domain-containing protein [Anaerolineae bacterium]